MAEEFKRLVDVRGFGPGERIVFSRYTRQMYERAHRWDSVVAYWVLDDYPGDVRPALELIHRLVQEDTRTGRAARPTICGFGGNLDNTAQSVEESRAAFDAAVVNFTPLGCDAVALYPYAAIGQTDQDGIDWGMSDLLPYMLNELRTRGWDPNLQPLIGIPQTFALAQNIAPGESSVATQTAAYCRAGAHTILFYAWDDSFARPKIELFNSPELRSGAEAGLSSCRATWSAH
jgi:hypothetical protein